MPSLVAIPHSHEVELSIGSTNKHETGVASLHSDWFTVFIRFRSSYDHPTIILRLDEQDVQVGGLPSVFAARILGGAIASGDRRNFVANCINRSHREDEERNGASMIDMAQYNRLNVP